MTSLYWICLLLGGGVVVLQLLASLIGLDSDAPDSPDGFDDVGGHDGFAEGLHLFSVRSLSAGVAFFGVGGLAVRSMGLPWWLSVPVAVVSGAIAAVGVAALLKGMRSLESDRTLQLSNTVGRMGEVYLSIPGHESGTGKIHITVQERLMELAAVTREGAIATGAPILVIDTVGTDTVVVVVQPKFLGESDSDA